MSHRSTLVVPQPLARAPRRRLRSAVAVAAACAVCAGSALALAAPATAAPRTATTTVTTVGTGGIDPDTTQHATSMTPASAPDSTTGMKAHATPAAARTLQASAATDQQGVDVSSYQHPNGAAINWAAVRSSGRTFAFVKASESTGYANPYFAQDVKAASAAGLQVGAYHFARPAYSAVAQADQLASVMKTASTTLPPVLDLEDNGGLSAAALQTWASQFLARVQADTGYIPVIYTGPSFWSTSVGNANLAQYPLWIAHYTTASAPEATGSWSRWTFWQWSDGSYASPAAVPGISGYVDRDRFSGNLPQLQQFAAAGGLGPWLATVAKMAENTTLSASQMSAYSSEVAITGRPKWYPAAQMLQSAAGVNVATVADYTRLMGSAPSAAVAATYNNLRFHGYSRFAIDEQIIASPAFYAKAGGTTSGFVQAMFQATLGRAASASDVSHWSGPLTHGTTRLTAATALDRSGEGLRYAVNRQYQTVLGRAADAAAYAHYASSALLGGWNFENLTALLYGSTEFQANRVTS